MLMPQQEPGLPLLSRRELMGAGIAAGLLRLPQVPASAKENPYTATPRADLILGSPLTHSDWMLKPGIAWGPAGVRHMLDACKACGWSKVYWRALDGGRALYHSKLLLPAGKWDADSFWSPANPQDRELAIKFSGNLPEEKRKTILAKFDTLDYAHFDPLAEAVRYGREIGLSIHAWVSINEDDHGWGLTSAFSKAHPQFRWLKRDGTAYRSQLSFAFEPVQEYKLAILEEILSGYDVQGVFLDWIRTGDVRDNPQTDPQGVANSGYEQPLIEQFKQKFGIDPHDISNGDPRWVQVRAEPQTRFMRAARQLMRKHRSELPLAVLVAHPWHYRGMMDPIDGSLRGLLLDVRAWAREGLIDAAVAAGYYRPGGNAEAAYKALRAETEEKIDVWTYAWVPTTADQFRQDAALARRLRAREMLLWEADYIDDRPNAAELKSAMSAVAQK
jgi:hypothetical protein